MNKQTAVIKKTELGKVHFIPAKLVRECIEVLESDLKFSKRFTKRRCDNSLDKLQQQRIFTIDKNTLSNSTWYTMFMLSCRRAVFAQDWDKLLFLLKKFPKWKFRKPQAIFHSMYTRYLLILLMYHPTSQANGLLCEYLHMGWGCRADQDKKAILKVLLMLPKRLPRALSTEIGQCKKDEDSD